MEGIYVQWTLSLYLQFTNRVLYEKHSILTSENAGEIQIKMKKAGETSPALEFVTLHIVALCMKSTSPALEFVTLQM